MIAHRRATWLLAAPAIAGLIAFLSFWGMVATVRLADIEVRHSLDPEPGGLPESWFWAWAVADWLGLMAFLFFGMAALFVRGRAAGLDRAGRSRDGGPEP